MTKKGQQIETKTKNSIEKFAFSMFKLVISLPIGVFKKVIVWQDFEKNYNYEQICKNNKNLYKNTLHQDHKTNS